MPRPNSTSRSSATGRSARRLANLLGMSGIKTVVLEREPSVYHLPRAVSLDGEGMRLFQTMGLADKLLPKLNVSRNIRHVNTEGKLLLLIARGGVGPDGWNNAYRFYQPELERSCATASRAIRRSMCRLRCDVFALDERRRPCARALRKSRQRRAGGADRALCRRLRRRAFDGAPLHGRGLQDLRSHERWIVLDMILSSRRAACRKRPTRPARSSTLSSIAIRRGRRLSFRCRASGIAGNSC